MSANFLNKLSNQQLTKQGVRYWLVFALPFWVLASFGLSQGIIIGVALVVRSLGVPLSTLNPTVLNTVLAACIYILSVVIVIGLPWWIKKYRTSKQEVGLARLPNWLDLGLAPAGVVVYLIISVVFIAIVGAIVPSIDKKQIQETRIAN
jgi:hypothetical protein